MEEFIFTELNKVKTFFNIICIGNWATSATGRTSRLPTETAYIRDTFAAGAKRCQLCPTKLGDRLKSKQIAIDVQEAGIGQIECQVTKRESFEDTCFRPFIPNADFLLLCTAVSTAITAAITTVTAAVASTIASAGVAIVNLNMGMFSDPPVQAYLEGLPNIYPRVARHARTTTSKTATVSAAISPTISPSETATISPTAIPSTEIATKAIVGVGGGQPEIQPGAKTTPSIAAAITVDIAFAKIVCLV